MKIVVVDDEINALEMFLRQIILKQTVDYRFFRDEPQAILDYVAENEPDGAFLDVKMPGIDGFDLAKKILEICPRTKIVFVTGLSVTMERVPSEVKPNCIGIMYKPYNITDLEKHLYTISLTKPIMKVTTFGPFNCSINGHNVNFSSSKSTELFALLVVLRGKSITMNATLSLLWPDKEVEKAKKLYRDAVWRLRETLKENNFEAVTFGRAQLSLDTENIDCDYYRYLNSKDIFYGGDFLMSYEWSLPYQMELDDISEKRNRANY